MIFFVSFFFGRLLFGRLIFSKFLSMCLQTVCTIERTIDLPSTIKLAIVL